MKRHKHSLSHYKLLSCDMGQLIPINCTEVLPGDTFQGHSSALIRVSPLVAPVMHPVHVRIHHWFVPYRIIWDGWEDFITGNDPTPPPTEETEVPIGSIGDYMGLPNVTGVNMTVNQLPLRAYWRIYNEFYRDQDLVAEVPENVGNEAPALVSWEKDYFTSARPWPQKGGDITVPVGSQRVSAFADASGVNPITLTQDDPIRGDASNQRFNTATNGDFFLRTDPNNPSSNGIGVDDLRNAFALQRYAEARARYGSRYTEYLRYLGVSPADSRLQRPEYLGGGKQTIAFSEVLQTAEGTDPVGDLKGHGIAALKTRRYRKFFQEHGVVISLMSVRPKAIYTRQRHRMWDKQTKEDYWQKELEHIGQQPVYNRELNYVAVGNNDGIFGYQDRYDEYRRHPSGVCGEFRDTLNYWHMARDFASMPVLNESFIECDPTKRIHAVQTNQVLWVMVQNTIRARRMVSRNATPRVM